MKNVPSHRCGGTFFQHPIGPYPIHEVVVMAVRKAVSAATIIFTANSIHRCFFIIVSKD